MKNNLLTAMASIAANLLLLLVASLFSLVLLEQGFRCWLFGWQAFDIEAVRNNVPVNNAGLMQQSTFDDIYWELKPGLDTTFKFAHLTTNSYGLAEDREYPLQKPPGSYRIAVLGDSYSMSSGVDTDKSYHALVEQWLNRDYPHTHYEIINFAVGGFGLERYNATLQHKVPAWQPDAILLGYCGHNDHIALPPATGTVPPFNPPRADGFQTSYVLDYIHQWQADHSEDAVASPRPYLSPVELTDDNFVFIDTQFARLRTLADAIRPGMPVIVVFLDNRTHRPADLQALEQIAARHDLQFIDTSAQFAGRRLDDYSIHLLDSHPNAAANRLFAATLYGAIRLHGWLATGTETSRP